MDNQVYESIIHRLLTLYDKDQAATVAWWLLEALTNHSRAQLIALDYPFSDDQRATLAVWLDDHINHHKPLAYIIGWVPFCELRIHVQPPLLIPRPETEEWVTFFINQLKSTGISTFSLLDVCTGTGCIALAIAHAFPQATIYATDINPEALLCARENAALNNIKNVTFIYADLFENIDKKFDFIVSNPPYISHDEASLLLPAVQKWEDPRALFAEDKGYALIKRIITQAPLYLHSKLKNNTPNVCIEIGYRQGPITSAYMKEHGYADVHILKDYAGHDRVVCGRYDEKSGTDNE